MAERTAREARAAAVRDFFFEERLQELAVRPLLLLGTLHEVTPRDVRWRVQAAEQRVEIRCGVERAGHETPPGVVPFGKVIFIW
ncbi:MAG: hypothetical protein R3B13_38965 [Polyangiaceae bacterium]